MSAAAPRPLLALTRSLSPRSFCGRYRKYKPLTKPGKCEGCHAHAVRFAYHALCGPCASAKKVCAKCRQARELWGTAEAARDALLEEADELRETKGAIPGMPERERRSRIRALLREAAGGAAAGAGAAAAGGAAAAAAGEEDEDEDDDEEEEEGDGDDGDDGGDLAGGDLPMAPAAGSGRASVGAGTATSSRRTAASATAAVAAAAAAVDTTRLPPGAGVVSDAEFAQYLAQSRVAGDVLAQALAASKRKAGGR